MPIILKTLRWKPYSKELSMTLKILHILIREKLKCVLKCFKQLSSRATNNYK